MHARTTVHCTITLRLAENIKVPTRIGYLFLQNENYARPVTQIHCWFLYSLVFDISLERLVLIELSFDDHYMHWKWVYMMAVAVHIP